MNKIAKAVRCIETGIEYVSSGAAGKAMGIDPSGILKCCKGLAKTAAGKTWEFVENTANTVAEAVKDTVSAVKEAVAETSEKKVKLVRDYMKTNVVTVKADAPLMFAEHIMFERKLLRLPVVTAEGKLIGIITKYDIEQKLAEIGEYTEEQMLSPELSVMKFVKAGLICTMPDEPLTEVVRAAEEYNAKFLPVIESAESNKLVGIITYFDALNVLDDDDLLCDEEDDDDNDYEDEE